MTNPNSFNNHLVRSTKTETEILHISETKMDCVIAATEQHNIEFHSEEQASSSKDNMELKNKTKCEQPLLKYYLKSKLVKKLNKAV